MPEREPSVDESAEMAALREHAAAMIAAGVRRIHTVAWRDLDDDDAGGSEAHADEFMRRFAEAGLDVTHRTSFAVGRPETDTRNGYRVIRRGSRYSVFPRTVAAELFNRMGEYDAFVEIWNGVPWFSPVWCRKPRITFLHHVHGPMWDQMLPGPLASLGRTLEARIAPPFYRRTSTVTPSEATREELIEIGFRPEKVTAVNNGVDPFFAPGGTRAAEPTVVAVGRQAPVKRFEKVVEAAVVAKRRVPGLRIVLVGDGPERSALTDQIARHGAQSWISMPGRLSGEQLRDAYRSAWLVTSASLAEGWGLTLTEAAACGTPAVASDIRGHRCSVLDGRTGVLAPVDRLGDALADLLLDDDRRDRLAAGALEWARSLTWDASALGVIAALRAEVDARR